MRALRGVAVAVVAALGLVLAPVAGAAGVAPVLTGSVSNNSDLAGATSVAIPQSGPFTNYAYTTAYHPGELTAVDFSNPASPVVAGSSVASTALTNASTVNIVGGFAYVASKNRNGPNGSGVNDDGTGNSLTILNVSTNPGVPQIVGSVTDATKLFGAYGVAVSGQYAYIAAQGCLGGQPCPNSGVGNSFEVVDISNPAAPTIVAGLSNPASGTLAGALDHACSVTVSGHYAYVTAAYSNQLTIIDIANPLSPVIVSSLKDANMLDFPVDVAVKGNYAYVADQATPLGRIAVVNVSNPASPHVVANVTDVNTLNGAYRIRLSGNFAYVSASSAATVTAIDISNPLSPRETGHLTNSADLNKTTGLDIDPTAKYAVANSPYLSSQSNQIYPPFTAGTGSVSVITLDPTPISVNISANPANPTAQTSANFTFAPGDQVSSVLCSLDGAPPVFCTSATTQTYGGLAVGPHTFTVEAADAAGAVSSASYSWTIEQAPANTGAPSISGPAPPVPGAQLSASTGTWMGTSLTFAYQWFDCNLSGSSCPPITGATSSFYTVQGSDLGFKLEVTVTGSNGVGSQTSPKSAPTAVVVTAAGGSRPVNLTAPSISGTASEGQTLTAATGAWSGVPTPTFTYQWADCDSAGANCSSPLPGATSPTYTVQASDVGFTLRVTVTGSNGVGAPVSGTSAPTAVVTSAPVNAALPVNTALPLISGTAAQGKTLTASTGTWSGTPAPTFTYQWVDCGPPGVPCSTISAATHPTYTIGASDVGSTLRVLVLGTNSAGSGRAVSDPTAVVTAVHPAPTPKISRLRQAAKMWLEAPKPGKPKPKRLPTGTTFSLTLNMAASVSFRFTLKSNGRKLGGRCRTQTSQNRHRPRCTLKLAAGALVFAGHKGANKLKFVGRLAHGKKLRPGAYTVAITATATGRRSKIETLNFTIAP